MCGICGAIDLTNMTVIPPEAIRNRPKKPFGTPIQAWFATSLQPKLKEVLYDPLTFHRTYFNRPAYSRLPLNHFAGRTSQPELVWRLVNSELWQRTFFDHSVGKTGNG